MNFFSRIMSYLLFALLMLISFLPFFILYGLADLLALILFHVLRYRRKVVMKNLDKSLPAGTDHHKIAWRFYRSLADVVLESVKCMSIGRKNLLKRIHCDNPEIMEEYARQNRSVIYLSGHYGNWEYLIYAMNLIHPHLAIGVGKPLTNKVLNKLINGKRSKFGMKIINAGNIKEEFFEDKDRLTASLFLADQYPGGVKKGFPATFLNRETSFMYGAEKYAKEYNFPVVYADIERIKRGRFKVHLVKITDKPCEAPYGEIMNTYIRLMEQTIIRNPAYWLWSHKRWKQIEGFYR